MHIVVVNKSNLRSKCNFLTFNTIKSMFLSNNSNTYTFLDGRLLKKVPITSWRPLAEIMSNVGRWLKFYLTLDIMVIRKECE